MAAERVLNFDGWTINRLSGEIERAGRTGRLPQQPLRSLVELYDNAGQIVIETLPRVGYRFVAEAAKSRQPVDMTTMSTAPAQRGRRLSWRSGLILVAVLTVLIAGLAASRFVVGRHEESARHIPTARAQELYLEGMHERSRRDIDATPLALTKLEAAIREDPEYADAWAGYSRALSNAVVRQRVTPAEGVPKARAAAKRMLDEATRVAPPNAGLWHYSAMWNAQQGFGEAYEMATIYATLGDLDRGCELLARSLTDMSFLVNWMRIDPRMDPLRGRQCFSVVEQKLYGPL